MEKKYLEIHWVFAIEIALAMLLGLLWLCAFYWTMDAVPEFSKTMGPSFVAAETPTDDAPYSLQPFLIDRSQTSNLVLQASLNNTDLSVFNVEDMLKTDFVEYDTYYSVAGIWCDDPVRNLCHNAGALLARYIVDLSEKCLSVPSFDCLIARVFVVRCTCLAAQALMQLSRW